jgi:hypothetical protein
MSPLSRRTLVATAAALPALALPAAVLPAAALPTAAAAPAIDSREAMVIRAQQMVDLLGTCYVREGWKLDAERGAQFVESVRTFDENDGDCPKFRIVLDWMHDHGQSLDWLVDGDVAGLITARAALRATVGPPIDAELIALGERLKAVTAEAAKLKPDRRLYDAAWKASGFDKKPKGRANDAAKRQFEAKAKENGYSAASKKWNAVCDVKYAVARAILRVPSNSRVGDGIRAAAQIVDGDGISCTDSDVLWDMAARAGFDPPASIARDLRRMAAAHARKAVQS